MTTFAKSFWKLAAPADREQAIALGRALNIPVELASLLVQRGMEEPDRAKVFLRPSLGTLSDPAEFKDLPEAAALIAEHVRDNKTIFVHGDYDVDGQCATALLTRFLRTFGATVEPFVPHRMTDGYDLSAAGIAAAEAAGASLIVTCDCGVTAHNAVAEAKRRGFQVIVTDHHLTSDIPPADAVVNPRRPDCPSTFKELCGAGLAFKLVQALARELNVPDNAPMHFMDLVALATVADLVPLVGENRTLVRYGLRQLTRSRWPGVRALVAAAGLAGRPLKAGQVGFILAPRLNAIGRIGDAKDGLRLLLTDDEQEAATRANELETINRERQEVDKAILKEAVKEVEESVDLDDTVGLVLAKEKWHPGVIGIVASRLVERYARPTVLIGIDGEWGKGSGRSVPGFDLYGALCTCAQYLTKFGGHKMAAGLTVASDAIEPFRAAFNEAARSQLSCDDLVHTQRVDAVLSVDRLDARLEKLLRHFEPCGIGNPAPVLAVRGARAAGAREVGELHLKFTIEDPTGRLSAIGFGLADRIESAWLEGDIDVAFRLEENIFQGLSCLQARVMDVRPAELG